LSSVLNNKKHLPFKKPMKSTKLMRLICILIAGCALALGTITSCSRAQSINLPENDSESSELIQTLEAVNDNFMANKSEIRGKGWGRKVLRVLYVATADIGGAYEIGKIGGKVGAVFGPKGAVVGAAVGGTIGAVGASYGAYCSSRSVTIDADYPLVVSAYSYMQENKELKSLVPSEGVSLQIPKEYNRPIEAGVEHNLMLSLLREESSTLSTHVNKLSDLERSVTESPEFQKAYNDCIQRAKEITFTPKRAGKDDLGQKVMNLFLNVYTEYPQDQADVNEIINKYISVIEQSSELSKEEKELIYSSLSVAAYSFKYWENELP